MSTAVLHLIDSLAVGGAERVAVSIVNRLPQDQYTVTLCTTRRRGPLADEIAPHVQQLHLQRRSTADPFAVHRLAAALRRQDVRVLHAHGTSLFLARAAAVLSPATTVIWHDHLGLCETKQRPLWIRTYRLGVWRIGGVIAVNQMLANWAVNALHVPPERVWCVRNMACLAPRSTNPPVLPGRRGSRIVCLANFRPEKDHTVLIQAMARVVASHPDAHLLLVGGGDPGYVSRIRNLVALHGISKRVTFLGERRDVPDVLGGCDVGVLASVSEGLPLSLLECGSAGLAVAATSVGECPDVLDGGRAGLLVPPSDPGRLADALLTLVNNLEMRSEYARRLQIRIRSEFSPGPIMDRICRIYDSATGARGTARMSASAGAIQ
ncbi:MAG: glycosyltransferase [Bryobacterales bacterium]|nr:glycosyltransferase [Bryobacterales bacterium]